MSYQDRGHYYVNGVLTDHMTKAKCRDAGGIPSVTTKIDSWTDSGLVFWKIRENIDAAYRVIDSGIGVSAEDFRKLVADEFYRVHNELFLGSYIHDILDKLIKNGVENRLFMSFYKEYADRQITDLFESVQMAYEWYREHVDQAKTEQVLYDQELRISGTCDVNGMIISPDGTKVPGGVDWKCSYVKKHPGYKKADGTMKSFGFSKSVDYSMQLGAYGRVCGWKGAYIVKVSTNPLIPGVQALWYDQEELLKGYKIYGHVARAYDLINGYIK
ncbi:MAG: hypothetical protein DRH37_00735 [Deltaproteobacteria bacterium]|nr:MAG: hypothetical protein DRH37_00735 [Deltaproteobacteria bacterium]